jgi:hypothetical protein
MPDVKKALRGYRYTEGPDGLWSREGDPETQQWQETEDGWVMLDYPRAPVATTDADPAGGAPWGRVLPTGRVLVPYSVTARFEGVGGLHPATHPEAFVWTWPAEKVAEIYRVAAMETPGLEPARFHRGSDGQLVEAKPQGRQR